MFECHRSPSALRDRILDRIEGIKLIVSGRIFLRIVNAYEVVAAVRGDSGELYEAGFVRSRWRCSCPSVGPCSHLMAVQRVSLTPGSSMAIVDSQRGREQ
jgi:hypothetical protein